MYLTIEVTISCHKSPEEDVVELDVAVVGLVLDGALHEEDELALVGDVHGEV